MYPAISPQPSQSRDPIPGMKDLYENSSRKVDQALLWPQMNLALPIFSLNRSPSSISFVMEDGLDPQATDKNHGDTRYTYPASCASAPFHLQAYIDSQEKNWRLHAQSLAKVLRSNYNLRYRHVGLRTRTLLVQNKREVETVLAIKGTDRFCLAFNRIQFGPHLVVGSLSELHETEGSIVT